MTEPYHRRREARSPEHDRGVVPKRPFGVGAAEERNDEGDGDVDAEWNSQLCAVLTERRKGSRKNDEQGAEVNPDTQHAMCLGTTEDLVLAQHERKGYSHRVREDARDERERGRKRDPCHFLADGSESTDENEHERREQDDDEVVPRTRGRDHQQELA